MEIQASIQPGKLFCFPIYLFICCDHHDHRNHAVSNTAMD